MAHFVEMMSDTATNEFRDIEEKLNTLVNSAGYGEKLTLAMGNIHFTQFGYVRAPLVNSSWLTNYAPFRLMGAMMSCTPRPCVDNAPKGHAFEIEMYRNRSNNAASTSRTIDSLMQHTGHWNYNNDLIAHTDKHFVHVLHTTQSDELEAATKACEDKGMEYNALLSSMITPNTSTTVKVFTIPNLPERVVIIISKLSVLLMHRLVSMLPVLFHISLPNLPVPPHPDLLTSFASLDADAFMAAGIEWIDKATQMHNRLLPLIARKTFLAHINNLQRDVASTLQRGQVLKIQTVQDTVTTLERQIREAYTDLVQAQRFSLTGTSEAIDNLCALLPRISDLVDVIKYTAEEYIFVVRTTLQHYETGSARAAARRKISDGNHTTARMIKYLFDKEEYQVVIQHAFRLNFGDFPRGERGYSSHTMPNPYQSDTSCLRNPHLHNFYNGIGCWGDNGPMVTRALREQDYITAFSIGLAAVRSINLLDGAASDYLWADLNSANKQPWKCIRRVSDGEIISIAQFKEETKQKDEGAQTT